MYGKHGTPLDAWTLGSRWRYALVWGGLDFLILFGLMALFSSLDGAELLWPSIASFVISVAAHAFFGYPRAKEKTAPRQAA